MHANIHDDLIEARMLIPFCRVLGPTEIEIDGNLVDLGGPRTRKVLTVLSTGLGAPVPDDWLIDQVWRDEKPGNVVQALRGIVNRLRAGLGPELGHRYLLRGRGGYALTIPLEYTDHGRLPTLIDGAQRQLAHGVAAAAARDFAAAVALWRGDPWEELGDDPELAGARLRLGELYETAVEELQAARLALGDTASAIAALTHAVEASPYRERRWELLALALYRSGRQTDALAALQRIHRRLRADTGTHPGPTLRTLEHRILQHDPALLAPDLADVYVPPALAIDEPGNGAVSSTVIRIELHPDGIDKPTSRARLPPSAQLDLCTINADNETRLSTTGNHVDTCLVDTPDAIDTVRRLLQAKRYDIVFICAAIRFGSGDTSLLETIVNIAHALQPRCRFIFGALEDTYPIEGLAGAAGGRRRTFPRPT
ncbi:AfsR/SARP family transcriptional regulator [Nocardia vaccinii]|uniref:AfsR/SARP family transcriptional regulator n=1 Tax=Nocardia vaccinii TaxID=1822 RepID=UPI0008330C20|nr:AfsR/SARP family transcriptional regulator [Nocardia vaccinii]